MLSEPEKHYRNTHMKNIRTAEQEAHREFSKLIHTSISDIYTDTCFHVSFIMKHRQELKKSKHRVKVIKSVQMELKRKHKEAWARGNLKRLKKMHECFELLPANKHECQWIYQQKQMFSLWLASQSGIVFPPKSITFCRTDLGLTMCILLLNPIQ